MTSVPAYSATCTLVLKTVPHKAQGVGVWKVSAVLKLSAVLKVPAGQTIVSQGQTDTETDISGYL